MLSLSNFFVSRGDVVVLSDVGLLVPTGELHVIMGPNGAGKSTLLSAVAGVGGLETRGDIVLHGKSIVGLDVTNRSLSGIFLSFQHPISISGLSIISLLKASLEAQSRHKGQPEPTAAEVLEKAKYWVDRLGLPADFYMRDVNAGLSGGQKKLSELLQMAILSPKLILIDEIDSGLDVDALKTVANGINMLKSEGATIVLVSHYRRILDKVAVDRVHVLKSGTVVSSGGREIISAIDNAGYDLF